MKEKITEVIITVRCENAAFDESEYPEIARILRQLAKSFENSLYPQDVPEFLIDINGNKVGKVEIETEEVANDE